MKKQPELKTQKCPFCTPENPDNNCVLANAKTIIDGKEYSACCSNPKEKNTKDTKTTAKKPK
jgi:hypothetical protein